MALLYERLKKGFFDNQDKTKSYSDTDISSLSIDRSFNTKSSDDIAPTIGFMDAGDDSNVQQKKSTEDLKLAALTEQRYFIEAYRSITTHPDVEAAISEIVNEIVFSTGESALLALQYDKDVSDNVKDMMQTALEEITGILNFDLEAYSVIKQWYVDGQLVFNPVYDNKEMGDGIKKINILTPINLYYDITTKQWAYIEEEENQFTGSRTFKVSERQFKHEELFKIDSGLYTEPSFNLGRAGTEKIVLSELHTAIKPANQLKTSEDMLIPMRFSRSVSRRVFNVDTGDLSHNKSEEALGKIQNQFKYKKFYDVDNGTISNQNHVATLVEDYWFQNRSGAKGTTVDTLDETGNLGELGDILYFKKKLYTAMKIPMSRINNEQEGSEAEFDFTSTSVQRDEVKFFAYISRLRKQFLKTFHQLIMRHLIAQGKMTEEEWDEYSDKFQIYFSKENTFLENLETELFEKRITSYQNIEEMIGKVFSVEYAFKEILKLSDEEIKLMQEQMVEEGNNELYSKYYGSGEDDNMF